MDYPSRMEDESAVVQKENSPPSGVDLQQLPGAPRTKTTAGVFSVNNENEGRTFKTFQENIRKVDSKVALQSQQPLQPNNSLVTTNKPNEKVQPELLKKFRQLRQWQQQQQESMFKQQQEQMETLKMQQDKLQTLYKKAVSSSGSPSIIPYGPGDCQRKSKQTPPNFIDSKTTNEQKRNISMEAFFKTLKTQDKLETSFVDPFSHVGNKDFISRQQLSPTGRTIKTSPVLMTPMEFMSPKSYSPQNSPEDQRLSGNSPMSMQKTLHSHSLDVALQMHIPYKPEYNGGRDCEVPSLNDPSDLETQSDYQSDVETMSGVYPLQDDMSEAYSIEIEKEQRNLDVEEEEDSEDDRDSDLENTVRERSIPNSNKTVIDDEDRPINPGIGFTKAATFEELLEKELSNKQEEPTAKKSPSPAKPQRTFLRKGQGLARFKMKPPALKKQKGGNQKKAASIPPSQEGMKTQKVETHNIPSKQENKAGSSRQLLAVSQNKVQRKIAGRTGQSSSSNEGYSPSAQQYGSSILASCVIGPFSSLSNGLPTTKTIGAVTKTTLTSVRRDGGSLSPLQLSPFSSLDLSLQKQEKEWEEMKEEEDLEEFEMLEQAAANASFSSNSSLVVKVIQRARSKIPGSQTSSGGTQTISGGSQTTSGRKTNSMTTSRDSQVPSIISPVDTGYGSGEGRGSNSAIIGSQASSVSGDEDANTTDSESTEEEDSDNDTTLQEIDSDDVEPSSPRNIIPSTKQPQFGPGVQAPYDAPIQPSSPVLTSQEEFDDQEAWGEIKAQTGSNETDSDEDSDVTISEIFPKSTLSAVNSQTLDQPNRSEHNSSSNHSDINDVMSTPPTSALVSKLFPKLKPKPKIEDNHVNNTASTPPADTENRPSKEVQDKLKELEEEITRFRAENKALAKIRNERDEGLKRLQNEIDSFEKQKSEELERLDKFRDDEMQKLRRERRTFEKYQKAARNNPDKKEREEIEALRSQVAELQEEIKRRESRWSAANSRYRNRIEALEEQNKELQEEVKLLEKYRLEKWRDDEMKAKDNEEARPRDVVLRKTTKPIEPAKNEALNQPINYEAIQKEETIRQPQQHKSSPLRQPDITDLNNNKAKANDSTNKHSPSQSKPSGIQGTTEGACGVNAEVKLQDSGQRLKTGDKNTEIQSDIPGVRKLGLQEIEHPDGKVEHVKPDGSRVIMFANGTRKEIGTDGQTVIVSFFNGDIKQVFPDQRVVYYYSDAKTTHTTYPDGLEVLQFPNKQIEKHYVDGTKEIIFPDQTIKYLYVDGTEECVFADGTIQRMRGPDGERIIEFPNGQREVHTKHFKRREYPDGTVKTVYPDGRTETRYSTGRLRVKDRDGRVLVDTAERLLPQKE